MITDEIKSWIELLGIPNVGPKTFHKIEHLLEYRNMDVSILFSMNEPELIEMLGGISIRRKDEVIQHILAPSENNSRNNLLFNDLDNKGIEVIPYNRKGVFNKLKARLGGSIPPIFYLLGNKSILSSSSFAIVGKRNASEKALKMAVSTAKEMAGRGYNIVSGYARGVDTAAHLGALECNGTTIMVLPHGILDFKWKNELKNIQDIEMNTLVISQFPPETKWQVSLAMERNKVVIGLSDGILAVEFDNKGGTFDTINEALKAGVPVFVPDTGINRGIFGNYSYQRTPVFIKVSDDIIDIQSIIDGIEENKSATCEQLLLIKDENRE